MKAVRIWLKVCLLVLVFVLAGCAASGRVVFHTFEFDALRDSVDVEILQYRYGRDGGFNTVSSPDQIREQRPVMSSNTTGQILVGDDLYVKWRIRSSGQVIEDTVDLKSKLPRDMERQRLRFIVEGSQLYVYVISYDPVRPFFSEAEARRIRAFATNPREKALSNSGRDRVLMIHPRKEIDPHIPPEFRNPASSLPKTVTPTN
jgi:hypothetical protein